MSDDDEKLEAAADVIGDTGGTDEETAAAAVAASAGEDADGRGRGGQRRRGRPRLRSKPTGKKKMGRPKGRKTRLRWIQVPVSELPRYQRDDDDEDDDDGEKGDDKDDDEDDGEGDTDESSSDSSYCSDHKHKASPSTGTGTPPTGKGRKRRAKKGMIRPPPKRPRDMRRRTTDTSVTDVLQPQVSVAYQAMDDALLERVSAVEELARAERKLEDARRNVERAKSKIRRVDADISLRREDVMEAELSVPSKWNDMYRRLAAFKLEHGHCIVSKRLATNRGDDKYDAELAKWICDQRTHLKTKLDQCANGPGGSSQVDVDVTKESVSERRKRVMNRRSEYRIGALDKLGFVWNEYEALWDMQLAQLVEYKREHGDCYVPQRYKPNPQLGKWVMGQRKCYKLLREGKPTQMTEERIRRLEEVGFAWESNFPRQSKQGPSIPAPRPSEEQIWEEKFRQFADFRATHGHGHLYLHRGITGPILQLCHWAAYQRKQYKLYREGKPSFLTEERIERLNGVGFYWSKKGTRDDIPSLLRARAAAETAEGGAEASEAAAAAAAASIEDGGDVEGALGSPSTARDTGLEDGTEDADD